MLLKLSIDEQSPKGQNLQIDSINIDVEDSKKGLIADGCCCSCINHIDPNSTLKCCTCDELYHSACIKRPVPAATVKILNESPNCWWTCLHCVLNFPILNNTQTIITQQNQVDLDNFKNTLLSEMRLLMKERNAVKTQDLHRDNLKRKRDGLDEGESTPKPRKARTENNAVNNDTLCTIDNSLQDTNNDNVNNMIQIVRHNLDPSTQTPNTNLAQHLNTSALQN